MKPTPFQIAVEAALGKVAGEVTRIGPDAWSLTFEGNTRLEAKGRIDDAWLSLETKAAGYDCACAPDEWGLLERGATLNGNARFVLDAASTELAVRAEIALDSEVDLAGRLREVSAGFRAARTRLDGHGGVAEAMAPTSEGGQLPCAELLTTCEETGWGVRTRDSGVLEVDLDVPDAFHLATIEQRGEGCAAEVSLLDDPGETSGQASDLRRRALAVLLLRVGGAVRMVRPTITPHVTGPEARFGVWFPELPCAPELTHALGALSVACRIGAREASVLWADENLASAYLRQWDAGRERPPRAA